MMAVKYITTISLEAGDLLLFGEKVFAEMNILRTF